MDFLTDIKVAFLPELIIAGFVFINIFLSLFFNKKFYKTSQWIAILGVLSAFAAIGMVQAEPTYQAFNNSLICNVYTVFFKSLILVASFFVILISHKVIKKKRAKAFEHFSILFCAILGAMLLVSANDFLSAFAALEMLGISCYLLSALLKNYRAKESSLKYLISGIVASAVFLFGVSYIYGITGTINFDNLMLALEGYQGSMLFALASIMVVSALTMRISAMPFANYVPDVYNGSSYPVGAFLSIVPVVAGFSFLSRFLLIVSPYSPALGVVIMIFALLTICYGVYGALRQTDMRRFMGYSSTIQSGFMLLVLGVVNAYNISSLLYYLICYLFMALALWAGLSMFYNSTGRDDIMAYRGVAYSRPFYTTAMIFVLMAFAGLPPTSGFLAKFFVMSAIARLGFMYILFLLVALLLMVVGVCVYLKPLRIMFEKTSENINAPNKAVFTKITFYVCTSVTILLCLYSAKIIEFCELIAYSL